MPGYPGIPAPYIRPEPSTSSYTEPGNSMIEQLAAAAREFAGTADFSKQLSKPKPGQGNPGQGAGSFESYLASLGLNNSDFGVNMPAAPNLTAGVNDQYGGVLDFLRRSIGRTENQGEKASDNLGDIYSAMAQMNRKSGKAIQKKGRRTTKQIKGLYDKLGDRRDQDIEQQTGAVSRRLEDLGISAALPASTERMMKESGQDHRLIARQEGRAVSNSKNNTDNWANFAKAGAQGARLAGAEQQAELSQAVADAVFQLQGQIATTKSEKAAAMMAAQQAEYAMAADAAAAEQAAAMQKAGFAQQYQQMMMEQQAASAGTPQEGYDLISQMLMNKAKQEPGVNRQDVGALMEGLPGMVSSMSPRINNYGDTQDINQQDFYSQIREQAIAAGYEPALVDQLLQARSYEAIYGGGG